jgi:dihydroorotase
VSLVIRGGRLIDPAQGLDEITDLYIDAAGRVAAVGTPPPGFRAQRELDARDCVVCPGLVDLRARTREPGLEYKATIESEVRAAVAGGITTLACPPDTHPVIDTPAMAQMIQSRAWRYGLAFIHPLGALTRGLEGQQLADMEALAAAGCVGFSNALVAITDTQVMRRALEYAATFGLTVHLHAEDPYLAGRGCMHEGIVSARLGLTGIPEAAETVAVARELALIEQTGCRAHFCGISSARAVAMIAEARARGLPVTADVTAHHLHLTEHDVGVFDTLCHVRPPLRSHADREALREAVRAGVIDAICSDHQPHEPDAKLAPFAESAPGISGLETLLSLVLALVEKGVLALAQAIDLLTRKPAAILGIEAGRLAVGAKADVCVFDPAARWTVAAERLVSRGRNTPFLGRTLPGRVRYTLIGGRVVFERMEN